MKHCYGLKHPAVYKAVRNLLHVNASGTLINLPPLPCLNSRWLSAQHHACVLSFQWRNATSTQRAATCCYTVSHVHPQVSLTFAALFSYFQLKHVNAQVFIYFFFFFSFFSDTSRGVSQLMGFSHCEIPGTEMTVGKLAQVVHPPFRHWSRRIISQELAADWPLAVRRSKLRGVYVFGCELQ